MTAATDDLRREAEAREYMHQTMRSSHCGNGRHSSSCDDAVNLYLAGALAERPRAEKRARVEALEWALMSCQPPADLGMLRHVFSEEIDRLRGGE